MNGDNDKEELCGVIIVDDLSTNMVNEASDKKILP